MEDFVSAQTYALRNYDATTQPAGADHWGFAWSPKNASGTVGDAFDTQSGQIIGRLASAIHDSDSRPIRATGRNACGVGQNWCATAISGAAFNGGWQAFALLGTLALAFATPAQAITAGSSRSHLAAASGLGHGRDVDERRDSHAQLELGDRLLLDRRRRRASALQADDSAGSGTTPPFPTGTRRPGARRSPRPRRA